MSCSNIATATPVHGLVVSSSPGQVSLGSSSPADLPPLDLTTTQAREVADRLHRAADAADLAAKLAHLVPLTTADVARLVSGQGGLLCIDAAGTDDLTAGVLYVFAGRSSHKGQPYVRLAGSSGVLGSYLPRRFALVT